jgi:hypothetical protein
MTICKQCQDNMHRCISILEGKTVNLLAYGCDGGDCDYSLRQRLDEYTNSQIALMRQSYVSPPPLKSIDCKIIIDKPV